jgi:hypothetical protein
MIYLYVKTHNKTGKKYLGKTTAKDPYKYQGSGKYWKLHLKQHGYDCTTEIIHESEDALIIKEKGIYYSQLWNIVESNEWANLKEEQGDGGAVIHTPESNKKRSESMKGRIFSDEHRKKLSEANKGKYFHSPEVKAAAAKKASEKLKGKKKPHGFGEKISKIHKNKIMSDSSKEKMKLAWTDERKEKQSALSKLHNSLRPIITCPHCGKQGKNKGNMTRYHFENCSKCLHLDLYKNPGQEQT